MIRRLDGLALSIMDVGVQDDATDLELLIVITLLQNRLLTIADDPALRALVAAMIGTEDRGARAVIMQDFLDVCRDSPTVH